MAKVKLSPYSLSESIDIAEEYLRKALKYGYHESCQWGIPESEKIRGGPHLFVCRCSYQYISGAHCQLALTTKKRRYQNKIERKEL